MENNSKSGVFMALGTFDGLHPGHKSVITACENDNLIKKVLMFREHPAKLLAGRAPSELITKQKEKKLLAEWGVTPEYLSFSEIMSLSPEEFFNNILIERFSIKQLSCGFNYRFGKDASGDAEALKKLSENAGIELAIAEPVMYKNRPISSTRIRTALKNGEIREANAMLGRRFSYDFEVVHGDARGRTLGSPTINQFFTDEFTVPEFGVYASFTEVAGKSFPSVTNIGVRPTIGNSKERSETHIIGFDGDLYGQSIEVSLIEKMRGEKQFSSLDELGKQIRTDRETAVKIAENEA